MKALQGDIQGRKLERTPFHFNDGPNVHIFKNSHRVSGKILDLTATGVGIAFDVSEPNVKKLHIGDEVIIEYSKTEGSTGLIVHKHERVINSKSLTVLGVLFVVSSNQKTSVERRGTKRYTCRPDLSPSAFLANPLFFNDFILFNVENFSSTGARLKTISRDALILIGQDLRLNFMIPLFGSFDISVKVVNVTPIKDTKSYAVNVNYVKSSPEFMNSICEYILTTDQTITLSDLRKSGFPISSIKKVIRFSYAKSKEEMQEILKLRLIAHKSWGRLVGEDDPNAMYEELDECARHIVCRINDRMVACARIILIEAGDVHKSSIAKLTKIPQEILASDLVELTRICTHPEYRSSDIFTAIVQNSVSLSIQSGCKYLIGSTVDTLWPIYKKSGMKKFGQPIENPLQPGQMLNFICADNTFVTGKNADPIFWNFVFFPVIDFLQKHRGLDVNSKGKVKLALNRVMSPVVKKIVLFKKKVDKRNNS